MNPDRHWVRTGCRWSYVSATTPSLHRHYPASIDPLGLRASTVLCVVPTPLTPSVVPCSRLEWTYSHRAIGLGVRCKNEKGLIGCHVNVMCSAKGPTTPGPHSSQAIARGAVLLSTFTDASAGSKRNMYFGADTIHGRAASSVQFILTTFLCTFRPTASEYVKDSL